MRFPYSYNACVFCIIFIALLCPECLRSLRLLPEPVFSAAATLIHPPPPSPLRVKVARTTSYERSESPLKTLEVGYEVYINSGVPFKEPPVLEVIDVIPREAEIRGLPDDVPTLPSRFPLESHDNAHSMENISFVIPLTITLPSQFCNRQILLRCNYFDHTIEFTLPPPSGRLELHVLSVNDYHGRIGTDVCGSDEAVAVNLAAQLESKREEYGRENCIFVSIGDLVGASQYESAMESDHPTLRIFEALNVTGSVLGNHELMKGRDYLMDNIMSSRIHFLSANVVDEVTKQPIATPYITLEFPLLNDETYRLTLLGLVTQDTEEYLQHEAVTGFEVLDPAEVLTKVLEEHELGDIILLAHMGVYHTPDVNTLEAHLLEDTEFTRMIDHASTSVIAIINGHTHDVYSWSQECPSEHCPLDTITTERKRFSRPVIQSGNYGQWLADITILVDVSTGQVLDVTAENILMTEGVENSSYNEANSIIQQVANIVTSTIQQQEVDLVGKLSRNLDHDDRYGETPMCDVVADGLLETAFSEGFWVDFALQNSDSVRQGLSPNDGAVLTSDVYNTLPLGNELVIVDLPGKVILEVLEQQWLPDGSTRRLCHSGLEYWYNSQAPLGSRIIKETILVRSEPFDPGSTYKVATNDFLSKGGNHYDAMLGQTGIRYLRWIENETLTFYISKFSPLDVRPVPRTLDQAAFLANNVTFTFSVPDHTLKSGQEYDTEIEFLISEPYKPSIHLMYEDMTFFSFDCGDIEPNRPYHFQLTVKQTYDGPPDARIMAVTQNLASDPLGYGLLAIPKYRLHESSTISSAMPSIKTSLIFLYSLYIYTS